MAISSVQVLPVGNALQVFLEPPASAEFWRVLRKTADDFTGHDDPDAFVMHDGAEPAPIDALQLVNGVTYYYRAYYWNGTAWSASATASGVPAATYADASVDVLTLVRARLEAGLLVEVQRGVLQHANGGIPVLLAPPVFSETRWPVVTVHLQNQAPGTRALGEQMFDDVQDTLGDYTQSEGYLADTSIMVIGWSDNADERHELQKAIRRVMLANSAVFAAAGIVTPSFAQQDVEDFERYEAPVYQTMGTFSCQAPILVTSTAPDVADVELVVTASEASIN